MIRRGPEWGGRLVVLAAALAATPLAAQELIVNPAYRYLPVPYTPLIPTTFGYVNPGYIPPYGQTLYDQMQEAEMARMRAMAQTRKIEAQAMATQLQNQRMMLDLQAKYDAKTRAAMAATRPVDDKLAGDFGSLFDSAGNLTWPVATPTARLADARAACDAAIAEVRKEVNAGRSVTVGALVDAKNLLYAYGRQALTHLKPKPAEQRALRDYLNRIDASLNRLADS